MREATQGSSLREDIEQIKTNRTKSFFEHLKTLKAQKFFFVSFEFLDVIRGMKSVVSVSSVVGSKTHIFFSNTDWPDLSDVLIILIRCARGGDYCTFVQ